MMGGKEHAQIEKTSYIHLAFLEKVVAPILVTPQSENFPKP